MIPLRSFLAEECELAIRTMKLMRNYQREFQLLSCGWLDRPNRHDAIIEMSCLISPLLTKDNQDATRSISLLRIHFLQRITYGVCKRV